MQITDIPQIESENNINIRVYSLNFYEKENQRNYYLSKIYSKTSNISLPETLIKIDKFSNTRTENKSINTKQETILNLLLFKEHYMYIKSLPKLLKAFPNGTILFILSPSEGDICRFMQIFYL